MKRIVGLITATLLFGSSAAHAGKAAVAPLVADGVKDDVAVNVTNLVAMELDFMGQFDAVQQMDPRPSGLDKACVTSASCLARIQQASGADALVAGVLVGAGKNVTVQLAYIHEGKLVRAKQFTAEATSSILADRMGGWMEELVTGVTKQQKAKDTDLGDLDALSATDILAAEDADDEDAGPRVVGRAAKGGPIPTLESRASSEDLTAPPTPEEEKAEAARKVAEAQARAEEAARAAQLALEEADAAKRQAAAAAGQETAESWEDISFAPAAISVESIQFESAASLIQVESAEPAPEAPAPTKAEPAPKKKNDKNPQLAGETSAGAKHENDAYASPENAKQPDPKTKKQPKRTDYAAIGAPPPKKVTESRYDDEPSRTQVKKPKEPQDGPALIGVTARVGFTQFQALGFLTYGGELVLRPTTHVAFVLGGQGYSVHRNIPEELVAAGQPTSTWNTIFPINVGAQYRLRAAKLDPYVGADGIVIPGYVRAASASGAAGTNLAGGARVRAGLDLALSPSVALNLDAAVAYLSGQNFQYVEDGMNPTGVAPQISAGTVFLF
jgi:hypothetical protein